MWVVLKVDLDGEIATLPDRRKMLAQTTQIYFGKTISAL